MIHIYNKVKLSVALLLCFVVTSGCSAKKEATPQSEQLSPFPQESASIAEVKLEKQSLLPQLQPVDPNNMDTTVQNWWFGQQVDEKNRPLQCVQMQQDFGEIGLTAIGPEENTVYLTFDFGYETGYSAPILDTLKEKQAQATFFIVQQYALAEEETLARMIQEGHSIGSHSITHPGAPSGIAGLSVTQQIQEIGALADIVKDKYGYDCYLFRAPEGIFSEQTLGTAANLGYYSVFWGYAYNDWSRDSQPDVAESLQKALDAAHPGAIYLLHPQSTNTEMLPALIDGLREKGFAVKGL